MTSRVSNDSVSLRSRRRRFSSVFEVPHERAQSTVARITPPHARGRGETGGCFDQSAHQFGGGGEDVRTAYRGVLEREGPAREQANVRGRARQGSGRRAGGTRSLAAQARSIAPATSTVVTGTSGRTSMPACGRRRSFVLPQGPH